ncbi:MAG: hypothetical protein HY553_08920, partial [Elusimicrobia bacterium]|nr:hypothetical protein [Elusimicrobiota bacterium]
MTTDGTGAARSRVRVVVLTSTFLRHQFVANRLAEALTVVGVWQEVKAFRPEQAATTRDEAAVLARHFAERDASEETYFADDRALRVSPGAVCRRVPPGGLNDPAEVARMVAIAPDVLVVFGTGLLRRPLLDEFGGRLVNLHLGLSPYYRGAGTNFWPLVNREPEYVGATVHVLDAGIDTGPIIAHVRPDIAAGDGPHDIGN